jgi:hypothetical protein
MMKNFIYIASVCTLLGLAGCGSDSGSVTVGTDTTANIPTTQTENLSLPDIPQVPADN